MKKFLLCLALAVTGMVAFAQNFTITGTVMDVNSNPVANQAVYIYSDSSFGYYNVVYSDVSGNFSDVVPNGAQIGPNVDYYIITNDNCAPMTTLTVTLSNQQGTVTSGNATFTTCANSSSQACTASFYTYSPNNNFTYNFVDMSGGTGLTYSWDFGDGNTSALQNPTNTYAGAGTYTICLTVSDGFLCSDTYCTTIIVGSATCQANFYAYNDTTNSVVYLYDLSTSPSSVLTYFWDFGDGNTSTLQYPTHTYANYGIYNVCLTVADNSSCTSTYCDSVGFFQFAGNDIRSGFTINVVPPSALVVNEIAPAISALTVYPNPAGENAGIAYTSLTAGNHFLTITDISGKLIYTVNFTAKKGNNFHQVNLSAMNTGIYIVTITEENGRQNHIRLIKE